MHARLSACRDVQRLQTSVWCGKRLASLDLPAMASGMKGKSV